MKGALFAEDDPDQAEADCAEMNPEEATDPELARALLDLTLVVSKPLGGEPWGTYDAQAWADWGQSLVDDGTLAELPDVSPAFTNEYVEKAHADAG